REEASPGASARGGQPRRVRAEGQALQPNQTLQQTGPALRFFKVQACSAGPAAERGVRRGSREDARWILRRSASGAASIALLLSPTARSVAPCCPQPRQ